MILMGGITLSGLYLLVLIPATPSLVGNHAVLLERMQPLLAMLRERGHVAKAYVDHGWMLDRAAAARAGLGWLGKNTNLLVPGVGSNALLAEIVTSAELEPDQPLKKTCGSCDACMRVCPTGALIEPGVLDNRRCISFWTIEHRGVIPLDIRPLIGDWIFGCDLCQEICPVNASPRAAQPDAIALEAFGPMLDARPRLEELLVLDEDRFRARFRNSAVWRTRRSGLLRNVCVALGNIADRTSIPALVVALEDVEPLRRARVAVVVLLEMHAVHRRFVPPPGRDDVEREPSAAADAVDRRGLLREQRGKVEGGAHGDHQLEPLGYRGERRGGRPRVERRRVDPLDVVEVQFGDQREIVSDLLAAARQCAHVVPARRHPFVGDVAQPAAEDRHPVAETHQA